VFTIFLIRYVYYGLNITQNNFIKYSMTQKIFKNVFLLDYRSPEIEKKFISFTNKLLIKFNLWFSLSLFIIALIDTIYESVFFHKLNSLEEFKNVNITRPVSYIVTGIVLLGCILGEIFKKNVSLQRVILYTNFVLISFPFFNLRYLLFNQKYIEQNLFAMIRTLETVLQILMILLLLTPIPSAYLANLIQLTIICLYAPFVKGVVGISSYVTMFFVNIGIAYFYTRQVKSMFYTHFNMKEHNDWYSNLLEHMNSGFLAFKQKKIKFINKYFQDIIYRLSKSKEGSRNRSRCQGWKYLNEEKKVAVLENQGHEELQKNYSNLNAENAIINLNNQPGTKQVYPKNWTNIPTPSLLSKKSDSNFLDEFYLNNIQSKTEIFNEFNTDEILTHLLCDIKKEYTYSTSTTFSQISENFDIDKFLKLMKILYKESNMKEKFMLIGFKELVLDYPSLENSDNNNPSKKREILNFEVYFRCHLRNKDYQENQSPCLHPDDEEGFEIIFNDVTKIKKNEHRTAELKYKTQFLSKIAHEFKNPLICISELVEMIRQEKTFLELSIKEINSSYLKQIKSFSDYLLILIKDLNYFSFNNLGVEQTLEKNKASLDEILHFCQEMAEVLLIKYDKKVVKFFIFKNFDGDFKFYVDSIKLKQVLVNLISNSVKHTNLGRIEVWVNYHPQTSETNFISAINSNILDDNLCQNYYSEEILEFQVRDTGIGISEDRLAKILDPLYPTKVETGKNTSQKGLGLYIVQDILKQQNSSLEVKSKYGEGSTFTFKLKIDRVEDEKNEVVLKEKSLNNTYEKINIFDRSNSFIKFKHKYDKNANNLKVKSHFNSPISYDDQKSKNTRRLSLEEIDFINIGKRPSTNEANYENVSKFKNNQMININNNFNLVLSIEPNFHNLSLHPETTRNDEISLFDSIDANSKFIIIVDDEKITRKSTTRIVKRVLNNIEEGNDKNSNFNVQLLELEDGVDCLYLVYKLLKMGCRSITIISDENMKHMNGSTCAEVLKNLKNLNTVNIPFILLTAYHEIKCKYTDYFISKPLNDTEAKKILTEFSGFREKSL
jgi:signal transduction histidine kinase/CheY-like chemotaxis protein